VSKVLIIAACLLLSASPVAAGGKARWARMNRFTASVGEITEGVPERVWQTGTTDHVRGLPCERPMSGDLEGLVTMVANLNIDATTGKGTGWGTITYDVAWNGLQGTFEGNFMMSMVDFVWSGGVVAHGASGDFVGMRLVARFWATDPPSPHYLDYEGMIFVPSDS
jgi:hypothetical protein